MSSIASRDTHPTDPDTSAEITVPLAILGPDGQPPARRSLVDPEDPDAARVVIPRTAGLTDRGLVRANNEDQFLVAELERSILVQQSSFPRHDNTRLTENPQGQLLAVADGMGGHDGGEVASAVALDAMAYYVFALMPWLLKASRATEHELRAGLSDALRAAQARIHRVAARNRLDSRMGTTLTMAYVAWPDLYVVHAGDSRCYLARDGALYRLTRDHTVAQSLVDQQAMTEQEAARSRFGHMLVNVVGGGTDALEAEFHHVSLTPGDALVLCTDGLTGHLTDAEIAEHVARGEEPTALVHALVEAAKARGGEDNVTVVAARF